ncbi:hypothetical protein C8R44DRAFT_747755, partial [Mycena epipterygia]
MPNSNARSANDLSYTNRDTDKAEKLVKTLIRIEKGELDRACYHYDTTINYSGVAAPICAKIHYLARKIGIVPPIPEQYHITNDTDFYVRQRIDVAKRLQESLAKQVAPIQKFLRAAGVEHLEFPSTSYSLIETLKAMRSTLAEIEDMPPCTRCCDDKRALAIHQSACKFVNAYNPMLANAASALRDKKRLKKERRAAEHFWARQPVLQGRLFLHLSLSLRRTDGRYTCSRAYPTPGDLGRPMRAKRLTWKLLQQLPPAPAEFEDVTPSEPDDDATPPPLVLNYLWQSVKTVRNSFGVYREYPCIPTYDLDKNISLADQSNIPSPPTASDQSRLAPPLTATPLINPFKNMTIFGFMNWMWSGSVMKSVAECTCLVDFLVSDDFVKEDLKGFDLKAETAKFDKMLSGDSALGDKLGNASGAKDGRKAVSVDIEVPDGKKRRGRNVTKDPIPVFSVPGLHYRNLTQAIKSALKD